MSVQGDVNNLWNLIASKNVFIDHFWGVKNVLLVNLEFELLLFLQASFFT